MGLIVVGVDGSYGSLAALRWAAEEATRRRGRLVAVRAVVAGPPRAGEVDLMDVEHAVLTSSVRAALGNPPALPAALRVVPGPAPTVLLSAAAGADLLVVGARGHSALPGRILGSTAIAVARAGEVPVVVVPPARPAPAGDLGTVAGGRAVP